MRVTFMGLKDLFKPKWQHPDPKVRLNAIKKLKDESILIEIAQKETVEEIRIAAIKRINDEETLRKIIKKESSKSIRIETLRKLHSDVKMRNKSKNYPWTKKHEDFLKNIIDKDQSAPLRQEALINLNEIIQDKLSENKYHNRQYLEQQDDQSFLKDILLNDENTQIRLIAIQNIDDQSTLAEIALKERDAELRKVAADKISDEKIKQTIFKQSDDSMVRQVIIARTKNNKFLFEAANTDENAEVRVAAVKALRDFKLITRLAGTSAHQDARSAAEKILSEQRQLAKRVLTVPSGERWNLVSSLMDPDVLNQIAANESDTHVLRYAVEKLLAYVENITDQSDLVDIAKSDYIEVVRSAAIMKLEDNKIKDKWIKSVLKDALAAFKTEQAYARRIYLSDAIVTCVSGDTINFLGDAMHYEATIYKNYGEYPRERLVNAYKQIVGKEFPKKQYKNPYGAVCDDGGLLSALADYEARSGDSKRTVARDNLKKSQGDRWNEYRNERWDFSFSYPNDWIILSSDTSSGTWEVPISVGNQEGTGGPADFIVSVKRVEVLKAYGDNPNITIIDYSLNGATDTYDRPSTPSEYLDRMKEENNIKRIHVVSEKEDTLAGNPSIECTFYVPNSNRSVISRVITIFGKGITFQFKCQTPASEFTKFESIFNDILDTFKVET